MKKNITARQGLLAAACVTGLLLLAAAGWGFSAYRMLKRPNVTRMTCLFVYPDEAPDSLWRKLEPALDRPEEFRRALRLMRCEGQWRSGRYRLEAGTSNQVLARILSQGWQTPVNITFHNQRSLEQLAGTLSRQICPDSIALLTEFRQGGWIDSLGFTPQTAPALFLPDTYEVWWNLSPERLMGLFVKEYQAYWNPSRRHLADSLGLTPVQVSILASIIEEETNRRDEWPVVASLYLNRMRRGMLLQACPTVKFALGDFSLKRVLKEHTTVDSPYNTYIHPGLPPGPVRIPSKAAVDSVLHAAKTSYLYMCAKDDFSGGHYFSSTLAQHNRYAERYHQALNRRRIYH